jgi:hypothetical protein
VCNATALAAFDALKPGLSVGKLLDVTNIERVPIVIQEVEDDRPGKIRRFKSLMPAGAGQAERASLPVCPLKRRHPVLNKRVLYDHRVRRYASFNGDLLPAPQERIAGTHNGKVIDSRKRLGTPNDGTLEGSMAVEGSAQIFEILQLKRKYSLAAASR